MDRVKVDLTKYMERHAFVFDEVFDADASNQEVCGRCLLLLSYAIAKYCDDLLRRCT